MTRVNLLSPRFVEARTHRRRRRVHIAFSSTATLGLVIWIAFGWMQHHQIDVQITKARGELTSLQAQHQGVAAIEQQRQKVAERSAKIETLRGSMPPTAVLALLTQLTPPDIDMSGLTMEIPDPTDASSPLGRHDADAIPAVRITLTGAADDDVTIARYVTTLANHAATSNVRLEDSRKTTIGAAARNTFRISLDIPLFTLGAHAGRSDT